jgi:hypothetical protein
VSANADAAPLIPGHAKHVERAPTATSCPGVILVMIKLTTISVIGSFAPVICEAKTGEWHMTKLPVHHIIDIE